MRYHTQKPEMYISMYGEVYACNHEVYNKCTLFKIGNRGLAVIQQQYDPKTKYTYWAELEPWLNDILYLNVGFKKYFDERSGIEKDGLYPTVTVRQIMWALHIKPLKRARWETCFDRRNV